MADSDDEYDRKRRDKFRGERTEAYSRGEGRRGGPAEGEGRRREEWMERDYARGSRYPARGGAYRDYRGGGGGGGRDAYASAMSRDVAPAAKRMRRDWGDDRRSGGYGYEAAPGDASYNGGGYQQRAGYAPHHAASYGSGPGYKMAPGGRSSGADPGGSGGGGGGGGGGDTQPPVMSFKAFLITQDDSITDEQAMKKYNEYKLEFRRQQLNEFFVEHKDEEWFKIKYHPEDSVKRRAEQAEALSNRVKVFLEFLESGRTDKVSVDADKSDELIRLLDAVVIRLEGGTDADLLALDNNTSLQDNVGVPPLASAMDKGADGARASIKTEVKQEEADKPFILGGDDEPAAKPPAATRDPTEPLLLQISSEQVELQKKAAEFSKQNSAEDEEPAAAAPTAVPDIELPPPGAGKRKRSYSESGSDSGDDPASPGKEDNEGADTDEPPPPGLEEEAELPKDVQEVDKKSEDGEESEEKIEEDLNNGAEDISDKEDTDKALSIAEDGEEGGENGGGSATPPPPSRPRCLHRTASIFLRNLAASVTKQEVETMCRRFPGYLRVAIADPQPERRWFRRGWVTFERHVNIKDICWNLSNNRLRDHDLGAVVNRDLPQRVRTVNGITSHRAVVRNDIKLAARMVHNLDAKAGLWDQRAEADAKKRKKKKVDDDLPSFNLSSKNPVLKNITDYLIEEASAEEDELLGLTPEADDAKAEDSAAMCRDEELIRVLDRLLIYLRVVHSVDYYNHCEYPNEDEMPNRCGIVHARGIAPSLKISHEELSDYCQTFEGKIASFLQPLAKITTEEYNKLGPKDPDTEVEKFVKVNSQELSTDKWFCPLSGKKFKGPDFVRKHIFNKYAEKVDEVKREVEYYNNYLKDPKRPLLAEHPGSRQRAEGEAASAPAAQPYFHHQYAGNNSYGGGYGGGGRSYGTSYQNYARPRGGGGYPRGRGGAAGDSRPVIHYRDLDAAREPEEFV